MAFRFDIFALPQELYRAILLIAVAVPNDAMLNGMALVGRLWHKTFAPREGDYPKEFVRRVTLREDDIHRAAYTPQPWWRCVSGGLDLTDNGVGVLVSGCTNITTLSLRNCRNIGDAALKKLAACSHLQYRPYILPLHHGHGARESS